MILAPMAAGIVQMAISRTREYEADRDGGRNLWQSIVVGGCVGKKFEHYARGTMNTQAEQAKSTRSYVHHQSSKWSDNGQPILNPPQY